MSKLKPILALVAYALSLLLVGFNLAQQIYRVRQQNLIKLQVRTEAMQRKAIAAMENAEMILRANATPPAGDSPALAGERMAMIFREAVGIGASNVMFFMALERDGHWLGVMVEDTNHLSIFDMPSGPQLVPSNSRKLGRGL